MIPDSQMSLRAFGRHIKRSHTVVGRAIDDGRISKACVGVGPNGTRYIADPARAELEFFANNDLTRGSAQVHDQDEARRQAMIPDTGDVVIVPAAGESTEKPGTVASATERKKHWEAKSAELEFREKAGELANVAIFEKRIADLAANLKTRLLGVPSRAKQADITLSVKQYELIDALIREALEEPGT